MNPLLVVAVPLALIVLGMVLNSIGLSFDQPASSPEQDAGKRLVAEREIYRQFFDRQRGRAIKRQKRVGQFGWLLMVATIGSFIWLYMDTVSKTSLSNQIASLPQRHLCTLTTTMEHASWKHFKWKLNNLIRKDL